MSTIVVLAGGFSHERDVSIRSGRRVAVALRKAGHQVIESDVDADLLGTLQRLDDPVVVPMLHGGLGEDGALREVLDLFAIPYVGSDAASSRTTFDKSLATPIVKAAGVRVPQQVVLPDDIFRELGAAALMAAIGEKIGFPLMVKPSRSGSALGATKVSSASELPAALVAAFAYGPNAIIEQFVSGTEIAVTIVDLGEGPVALPAVEIRPTSGVYDYDSRYTAGATSFRTPADLSDDARAASEELALAAFTALGQRHLSRIDLIVADDQPWFLEANVAPGMTETSLAPLAMAAAGLDLGEVFAGLVQRCRP